MNHSYIILKSDPDAEKIDTIVRELVRAKWGSLAVVERGAPAHWLISTAAKDPGFSLSLWITSPRKIEFRKGFGDLGTWLQGYIRDNLAQQLGGRCREEGGGRKGYTPKPEIYATFKTSWYYSFAEGDEAYRAAVDDCWKRCSEDLVDWAHPLVFNENGELR